ncbi:MAG: TIGR00303 family protein [Candidatus Bathyarchaeota archaeon]|nr:TIGR00303 family protein [Candidatus Bathyarchaeota archaeon]
MLKGCKKIYDIILFHEESRGKAFIEKVEGKNPLFICVIGTTETAKIPGISAAGKYPELTDYTPPADVELLLLGLCKCIEGVPVTPEGIPTPALITMSALKLADIPTIVVNGGVKVKPHTPFIELGGKPGNDIRTGKAVENVEETLHKAEIAGKNLAKVADYLVIGESIPGGTTTTLGVLLAMGIDAKGKVSSSMPSNPHNLKVKTVEEGLKASNINFGVLAKNPIKAISCVGDPVIVAFSGLLIGAADKVPVLMAGGTQMTAILAVVKALNPDILHNLVIGTTRWIVNDKTADLKGIVSQIAEIPILASDLDFTYSKLEDLRVYEKGVVKEGVGAGGAAIAAMLKSRGLISKDILLKEIEKNYERLVSKK